MSYIRHHAIVVTGWLASEVADAASFARSVGASVIGPSEKVMNGYSTFTVCPDGSKEGCAESNDGDSRRIRIVAHLKDKASFLEWAVVEYGADDDSASVIEHTWMEE